MRLDFTLDSWSVLNTLPPSGDKFSPLQLEDFVAADGDDSEAESYAVFLLLLQGKAAEDYESDAFDALALDSSIIGYLKYDDGVPVAFYGPCLQSTEEGELYFRVGQNSFLLSKSHGSLIFSIDSNEKERFDGSKYDEISFVGWDSESDIEYKVPIRWDYSITEAATDNTSDFSEIAQEFFAALPSVKKLNKLLETDPKKLAEFLKKQPIDDYSLSSGGNDSIKPSELPVGAYEIVEFRRVEWPDKKTKAPRHAFLQQLRGVNSDVWVEGTQRKVVKDATWESYNQQIASGKVSWWLLIKGHREYTGRDGSPKKAAILQMVDSKRGHKAIADLQEGGDMKQVSEITAADVF